MGKIMKADMYRILRGPGFYVVLAVLLGFTAMMTWSLITWTGGFGGITVIDGQVVEIPAGQRTYLIQSAAEALPEIGHSLSYLPFFLLPLALIAAAPMFTSGAVKNGISTGICRVKLYLSKLLLSSAFALMVLLIYVLGMLITFAVVRGFGSPAEGVVSNFIGGTAAQFLVLLAFNFIVIFFTFVTKRTSAVIAIFIGIYFVPQLAIRILSMRFPDVIRLLNFELYAILSAFANPRFLTAGEAVRAYSTVAAVIVLTTVCGILVFRKTEIK